MRIINCTEAQLEMLRYFHPEQRISPFLALVPGSEYFFWTRRFTSLLDALSAYIYPISTRSAIKLPIVQCVAKLIGINQDGFLIPKVFKYGTLPEGNFKDFGISHQIVPLLDTMSRTLPYQLMPFPHHDFKVNCLGCITFDGKNDKYLTNFMPCIGVNRIGNVKFTNDNKIAYEGREYYNLLPSFNYHNDKVFQRLLKECHELKLLMLPLNFPLTNLKSLIGFTHPSWAEVKPLEFFLDESPENLGRYVLIRTDDGKIITWNEVVKNPKLRLEIEMSDYWLWQEACTTNAALENINLYWEFGMDYPLLIDKRDNTMLPVFIVED